MTLNLTQPSLQTAARDGQALKQVWQTIEPDSCPCSYNFHMHTTCSDGQLQPEQLMQQAVSIGLQGLAITDHHTIAGYQRAKAWLDDWQQNLPRTTSSPHLWIGVEINANLVGTEVHILGYAFDPEHPSLQPHLQGKSPGRGKLPLAETVIDALHQAGGLAVLAHPARYWRSAQVLIPAAAQLSIDGAEVYYAYNNPNPWQPSPRQTHQVKDLCTAYNLLHTCGTDTHGLNLLRRL